MVWLGHMKLAQEVIPHEDAVEIAKLLGEVVGLDAPVPARKRLLMQRLKTRTAGCGP